MPRPPLPQPRIDAAIAIAAQTSLWNAQRATGVNARTVAKYMVARGLTPRRRGNYTRAEAERIAHLMVF